VSIQKAIDDWLRKVVQGEISVDELKRIKFQKSFNRSTLRDIKNPRNQKTLLSTSLNSLQNSKLKAFTD